MYNTQWIVLQQGEEKQINPICNTSIRINYKIIIEQGLLG